MDIHRSRFVPFPASPINAVAFSRTDDRGLTDPKPALKLAIGRADGSIEIWNPNRGDWVQEVVFSGGEGKSIDALVWTRDPNDTDAVGKTIVGQLRLFSIGSTAAVTEWNLGTGKPLRASTGNFSEVWCVAAQPPWRPAKGGAVGETIEGQWMGQDLVAGCGDGTLAILSTADDDLTFKRFLARSGSRKTRCMSVIWQNRDRVVAGFSDSNIRIYDTRNGSLLRAMSLGAGIPGAPKDTLVWRVKCLPTGDIVTADSNGELRFWDGRTYSMTQRISAHDSDCLDIVVSENGQTVLSGGIDGKVAVFRLSNRDGDKRRWAKASHRRMHDADIKSMAVFDSKQMSVVVTGGGDTIPAVAPLRELSKEHWRRLPGLPQQQPCASAPLTRLLVSWWERSVWIWRIGSQEPIAVPTGSRSKKLVSRLSIKGEEDISDVAVSPDGQLLVVCTTSATKVFQLRPSKSSVDDRLRVVAVDIPGEAARDGARKVSVSDDGRWIGIVSLDNEVKILRVVPSTSDPKRLAVVSDVAELEIPSHKPLNQTGLKAYDQTINHLVFSPDSATLAVSDISGHVATFTLNGTFESSLPVSARVAPPKKRGRPSTRPIRASSISSSDSSSSDEDDLPLSFHGQTWSLSPSTLKLPTLDSAPLLLAFNPSSPSLLLAITQRHHLYELDTVKGRLTPWSRRNPASVLPPELLGIKDRVMGCIWDIKSPPPPAALPLTNGVSPATKTDDSAGEALRTARIWLYGATWLGMLDLRQDFAPRVKGVDELVADASEAMDALEGGRKRRASEGEKWDRVREGRKRARTSGAGGRVEEDAMDVDVDDVLKGDDMDDREEDEGPLRREGEDEEGREERQGNGGMEVGRRWWCTYKYRPILGVVSLGKREVMAGGKGKGMLGNGVLGEGGVGSGQAGEESPLEVVLVERPVWDLEHMAK